MFQCNKCGQCCRNLNKSDLYKELDRGDGVCKYLKENQCSVYEDRPLLCRIDECYEKFFNKQYTLDEYYKLNYEVCKRLQKRKGSNICHYHLL